MDIPLTQRLLAISKTSRGLPEVQKMIDRGDFTGKDLPLARKWLKRETLRRKKEFLMSPEGAGVRQANIAQAALWWSRIAVAISLIAIAIAWLKP